MLPSCSSVVEGCANSRRGRMIPHARSACMARPWRRSADHPVRLYADGSSAGLGITRDWAVRAHAASSSGLLNVTVSVAGGLRRYRGMGMSPGMRSGGAGWLRSEPGRMRLPPTGSCGPRQTLNTPMSTPTASGAPRTVHAHNTQMRSTGQQANDREHAHGAAAARQNILFGTT
jgi:hypothetical protein